MANSYQFDPKFIKRHKKKNIPDKKQLDYAFEGFKQLIDLMNKENTDKDDKYLCPKTNNDGI